MLFYLSFPLFVPLVNRVRGRGDWVALLALFTTSLATVTAIHLFAPGVKGTENFFVPRLWDMPTPYCRGARSPVVVPAGVNPGGCDVLDELLLPPMRLVEFCLGVFIAKLV